MSSFVFSQISWLCTFVIALITLFILEKNIKSVKSIITRRKKIYTERTFSRVSSLVNYQIYWCCSFVVALITLFILELKFRIKKMNIDYRNWINYSKRAFSGVSSLVFSPMGWFCTFIVALITLFILEIKYKIIKEYKKNNC